MKRQLKKSVVYSLYAISFALLVGGVAILSYVTKNTNTNNYKYVSKGILDYEQNVPVVSTDEKIIRPYTDTEVKIVKNFYDYKAESEAQEKSLIYYEGTYMQSSGISYAKESSFDVVAVYGGTVKEVKEDTTLGNIITIQHDNGVISIYESVSDITVSAGDSVAGGQIIAKSSTSNISTELGNHLYFELIVNGVSVNPENYYDKSIDEL